MLGEAGSSQPGPAPDGEHSPGAEEEVAQQAVQKLGQGGGQQQEQQQQPGQQAGQGQQGARPSLLYRLCGRTFGGRA